MHAATVASGLPGAQQGLNGSRFALEGRELHARTRTTRARGTLAVTPGFFETLDIPLRQGRLFAYADRPMVSRSPS